MRQDTKEMKYYMKPGEREQTEIENRQSKKIGKALTGKKSPPAEAATEKQKRKALDEYYKSCPFPKPKDKKPKKKVNGYKDKADRICTYTGRPFAERHEIFCGRNRQISIDNGFQIDVCPEIHAELQANITEWAQAENLRLRQKCQSEYEGALIDVGITPDEAREDWLRLIGRSYL